MEPSTSFTQIITLEETKSRARSSTVVTEAGSVAEQIQKALSENNLNGALVNQTLDYNYISGLTPEVKEKLIALAKKCYQTKTIPEEFPENVNNFLNFFLSNLTFNQLQEILTLSILGDPGTFWLALANTLRLSALNVSDFQAYLTHHLNRAIAAAYAYDTHLEFDLVATASRSTLTSLDTTPEKLAELKRVNDAFLASLEETKRNFTDSENQIRQLEAAARVYFTIPNIATAFTVGSILYSGYRFGVWDFLYQSLQGGAPLRRPTVPATHHEGGVDPLSFMGGAAGFGFFHTLIRFIQIGLRRAR